MILNPKPSCLQESTAALTNLERTASALGVSDSTTREPGQTQTNVAFEGRGNNLGSTV